MPAVGKHREAIIDAAIRCFRRQGYPGTGLNDLVAASGAPKGSLYHFFPGGKPSIAVAALDEAGRRMAETLWDIAKRSDDPGTFIKAVAKTFGGWLKASEFRDGCPMTTVLLELAPADREISKAGQRAYAARLAVIKDVLERSGIQGPLASDIACLWMSALNGALIEARVAKSVRPIDTVAAMLAQMLPAPAERA